MSIFTKEIEEKSEVIERVTEQEMVSYQAAKIFVPGMNTLHTTILLCMFLIGISAGEATREKSKLTAAMNFLGTQKAFSLQCVEVLMRYARELQGGAIVTASPGRVRIRSS